MTDAAAPALSAIVLAAGAATRFGAPKQLALLEGKPLIQHAIDRALEAADAATVVVLGSAAAEITRALPPGPFLIAVNDHWREGLASSIRTGLAQLPGPCEGVVLMLADQPRLTRESLHRLVEAWRRQPGRIVASGYAGTTGAPCIFPHGCFAELQALQADQGARLLLHRHPQRVTAVEHPEAAIDIDSIEDLAGLALR
jgi:molybdenum cofactor cytidylyltransferase